MEKDRYIRFDWAVKRLLRDKANFGVLEGLLTVLLGKEIHIMEILESERISSVIMISLTEWILRHGIARGRSLSWRCR